VNATAVQPVESGAALPPGSWLGLLGGGQLGRMFAMAAQSLGYRVMVLDPGADSPAGAVADEHLRADYLDDRALAQLAQRCRAASTEFENVPAEALRFLARHCSVSPGAEAVAIAQDRIAEKRFVAGCEIAVAPHAVIQRSEDCDAIDARLLPGILKSARLGYDGKGQVRVKHPAEVRVAFGVLGHVPCVLEKMLALALEVSVVVARNRAGQTLSFPVAENAHRDGILAVTVLPARIDEALARRAREAAMRIAERMDYVGVLCVEFFVLADDSLVVNEMAPRPHNSGHATIDACVTSQFEQQARVMAGLPLGDTTQLAPAVMLNLLGDLWYAGEQLREPDWAAVLAVPGAKLHLYGKTEARRGRKMGHVTCLGATPDEALARATRVAAALGLPAPR
jgi:5-(carboxyamino)imidazole ribonucleotide synthase